jgi:hypothetical protein
MKRVSLLLVLLAVAAVTAASRPGSPATAATADPCALPAKKPVWIDFADGSVPYWEEFARPGVVAAAANFIFPPQLRARGAKTVYWDMHLVSRVGTPTEPADPTTVVQRANRLYDYAAQSMGCAHPMITENELFGAGTVTPWAPANAQYRQDVLLYLKTLATRGARPVLLVSSDPYTGDVAGDWWRAVAAVSDIVRESYFPAPQIYQQGVIVGSRYLRQTFRTQMAAFLAIGVPPTRLGLMLGFQTTPGDGGRERLQPAQAWFEVTKWQALAARQVARDLHLATLWSWGWGVWSDAENDPDKPAAACVWLWTRDPKLCNGPRAAGPAFDASRTEGQLIFGRGVRCTVYGHPVRWDVAAAVSRLTGDAQAGFTAAYARAVVSSFAHVPGRRVSAAERAVIALHFHGSRAAYAAALARANATVATARGVIGDELRRLAIERRLRVPRPSSADIQAFYDTYGDTPIRFVESNRPAPWLGGARRGLALATIAPPQLFKLAAGAHASVRTMLGTYRVTVGPPAVPLGAVPLSSARRAIAAVLVALARDDAYQRWAVNREQAALAETICWRDQLPAADAVPLTDYLPFLAVD